jgi:hypothetical protein
MNNRIPHGYALTSRSAGGRVRSGCGSARWSRQSR